MQKKSLFLFLLFTFSLSAIEGKKQTICLNMIVKNEAPVITRCLESVLPIINSWVIVDTGSTDGTQQIIKDFLKDIPGELHERVWVDFSHNRNEALQLARHKADYILFMDADDALEYVPNFKMPILTDDCYVSSSIFTDATTANISEYYLPRIIKTSLDWRWEGVLHEHIVADNLKTISILPGIKYVYLSGGARSKDHSTFQKDIQILEKALEKEPENDRYVFYLARSYASAKDWKNSLKYYQKRVEMSGGIDQEVFLSLLEIGKMKERLNMDNQEVIKSYADAFRYRPGRLEPIYFLTRKMRQDNQPELAYGILKTAMQMPPTNDLLFIEKWIYDYGLLFEFSLSSCLAKKYPEALEACHKLLARDDLPEMYRKDTESNVKYIEGLFHEQLQQELLSIIPK